MKNRVFLPIVAAGIVPLAVLYAQPSDEGPGGGQGPKPPPNPIIEAVDANRDQTIDEAELAGASAALAALDENGDGQLTRDEYKPDKKKKSDSGSSDSQQDGPPPPPPPRGKIPFMKALDKNGDKTIDKDEIAAAQQSLTALDKNGDGQLTRDEFGPARPPGGGQSGHQSGSGQDGPPPEDN